MTDFMLSWQSEATVNLSTLLQHSVCHLIHEVWKCVCVFSWAAHALPFQGPTVSACGGATEVNTRQTTEINTFTTPR